MKPTTIPIRTATYAMRPAVPVPPVPSEPPVWRWAHVLRAPHRVGFFAASVVMALSALWWAFELVWRQWGVAPLAHAVPATWVHAVLMALGFLPLFFVGFLFTAGPKWLQQPDVPAGAVLRPVLACVTGWGLSVLGGYVHAGALAFGLLVVAWGWGQLTWTFIGIVRTSRVVDRLHAKVIAMACAVGVLVLAAASLSVMVGRADALRWVAYLGLVVVCGAGVHHCGSPHDSILHRVSLACVGQLAPSLVVVDLIGAVCLAGLMGCARRPGCFAEHGALVGASRGYRSGCLGRVGAGHSLGLGPEPEDPSFGHVTSGLCLVGGDLGAWSPYR